MYNLAIIIIVVSTLFYHLAQKSTPVNVSPIVSLFVTYLSAALFCVIIYPFFEQSEGVFNELKKVNWSSPLLGVAILGIEFGFLYAYRIGWSISTANLISSSLGVLALIPIGIFIYNEKISIINAAGVLLCIIGVSLINK